MTRRLTAQVVLQRLNDRKHYDFVEELTIDVTPVLNLDAAAVRALMRDFDRDGAPYLERLPAPDALALSAVHGGPSEVSLSIADFLDELDLVPEDAEGDAWLTEETLAAARRCVDAVHEPVEGTRRIFAIAARHELAVFDGAAWQHLGSFVDRDTAEAVPWPVRAPGI